MSRPRRLRWDSSDSTLPKHPYRDSVIVYGAFGLVVILVAWASGGNLRKTVIVVAAVFVAATGWSWWRWQQRLRLERRHVDDAGDAP